MININSPSDIKNYNSVVSPPQYLTGNSKSILQFDTFPLITKQDIDNGFIIRYFAIRISESAPSEIIEITKFKYNELKNIPLYTTIDVSWRIRGKLEDITNSFGIKVYTGVISSNELSIRAAQKIIPRINEKLINPAQFFQGE